MPRNHNLRICSPSKITGSSLELETKTTRINEPHLNFSFRPKSSTEDAGGGHQGHHGAQRHPPGRAIGLRPGDAHPHPGRACRSDFSDRARGSGSPGPKTGRARGQTGFGGVSVSSVPVDPVWAPGPYPQEVVRPPWHPPLASSQQVGQEP